MFDDILSKATEYIDENYDLELVEIVESSGATPRGTGAFMFVDDEGKSFGTVGGGNVEHMATLYALELLKKKQNGIREYDLSQNATEDIGMVCGGDNVLKFTYLTNNDKSKEILKVLRDNNKNSNTVYIFGGGHVSMELAKILKYLSFDIVIWDDREDFANRERFPEVKRVICKPFENITSEIKITKSDFIVIMTSGHAHDYEVEKQILRSDAFYIGIIGSKNKNKVLNEKLLEDGFTKKEIDRVCAPIGLSIGADTPEEIAISIAAELILFRAKFEERRKIKSDDSLLRLYS